MAHLFYLGIGWAGLVIFKTIVFLAAFCLVFAIAVRKSNFWLASVLSLPTIMILMARTILRPEMMSFLFIAISLYLLADLNEHPQSKRIFWLIPVQLIWVNMHLFFIVGIALVGGFLIEKFIKDYKNFRKNQLTKKLAFLLLALIAVSLINPNGLEGALYPVNIFNNYGINVLENYPPSYFLKSSPPLDNIPIRFFQWAAVILAVSFLINRRAMPIFYFLAAAATAMGGFMMFRLLSFFGLVFLPAASSNLKNIFIWLKNKFKKSILGDNLERISIITFIIFICYLIFLGNTGSLLNYKKLGLGLTANSNQAANFFIEQDLQGPIFNDFDSGSYLIYRLYPRWKVFVDNRPEAHSATFLSETYMSALSSEDGWQNIDAQYGFNTIFLYMYSRNGHMRSFTINRIYDPNWRLVYANSYNLILVRNNIENKKVIDEFEITPENVQIKLEGLSRSQNYDDQVAAADIYNLLGRFDLGREKLYSVAQKWPEKGKIWLVLGYLELEKNPVMATAHFERAISSGYKTPEAYASLGTSYKRIGEDEKAEEAFGTVLKIDPSYFDSK